MVNVMTHLCECSISMRHIVAHLMHMMKHTTPQFANISTIRRTNEPHIHTCALTHAHTSMHSGPSTVAEVRARSIYLLVILLPLSSASLICSAFVARPKAVHSSQLKLIVNVPVQNEYIYIYIYIYIKNRFSLMVFHL